MHTSTIYKQIQTYNTIQIYKTLYLYITHYINKEFMHININNYKHK